MAQTQGRRRLRRPTLPTVVGATFTVMAALAFTGTARVVVIALVIASAAVAWCFTR
jgi:hypothetical protein